jgi:hypothetical protein
VTPGKASSKVGWILTAVRLAAVPVAERQSLSVLQGHLGVTASATEIESQGLKSLHRSQSQQLSKGEWGQGGEMTQALYAHMNNKTIKKNN